MGQQHSFFIHWLWRPTWQSLLCLGSILGLSLPSASPTGWKVPTADQRSEHGVVRTLPKAPVRPPIPWALSWFLLHIFIEDTPHAGPKLGSEPVAVTVRPLPMEAPPICLILLRTF